MYANNIRIFLIFESSNYYETGYKLLITKYYNNKDKNCYKKCILNSKAHINLYYKILCLWTSKGGNITMKVHVDKNIKPTVQQLGDFISLKVNFTFSDFPWSILKLFMCFLVTSLEIHTHTSTDTYTHIQCICKAQTCIFN